MAGKKRTKGEEFTLKTVKELGYRNMREFKTAKRRQLQAVKEELNTLASGCGLGPNIVNEVKKAEEQLNKIEDKMSIKNWGR